MNENEEVKQNGVEYLVGLGLQEVANKTFIYVDELSNFLNGNFKNINKTKAMGFIQILQREYNIDLSDLKNKYIEYLQENRSDIKVQEPLIVEDVKSEKNKKGFFTIVFLGLAIGSIIYLVDKYDLLNFENPTQLAIATTENTDEIKDAKINLDKLNQDENKEIKKVEIDTNSAEVELDLRSILNDKKEEIKPTKEIKEAINSQILSTEANTSNGSDLSQLNSELQEKEIVKNAEASIEIEDNENESKVLTDAVTNEIYIVPTSKVWIGTIDLETLKKKDFLARAGKKVDIDGSKEQLLMIGHKFIKFYFNGKLVEFKSRGPIRFSYINGELKEIKRKEFNRLCKGRQW